MSFTLAHVDEWLSPNFQSLQPLEIWIMVVLFAALSLGWRLPLTRALLVLLLLHLSLRRLRFGELLGFCAPLLVASALASQLSRRSDSVLDRFMATLAKPAGMGGAALAGALMLAIGAAWLRGGVVHKAGITAPVAAFAAARAGHVEGPVLNDLNFGGYLIFSGVDPFIDDRYLYGDVFLKRYVEAMMLRSDQLPHLLTEYGVTWTLISPNWPAVVLLDHLPGWRRLYADDIAVVHVRDGQQVR
jgi:hypothetical protein